MKKLALSLAPASAEDAFWGFLFVFGAALMIIAVFTVYAPAGLFLAGAALVLLAIGAMRGSPDA